METTAIRMLVICLWAGSAVAQIKNPWPTRCENFVSKPCSYANGCSGMTACNAILGSYCSTNGSTVPCSNCGPAGYRQCTAFGELGICRPAITRAETCNSCDDDADGTVDEDVSGAPCTMSNGCSGVLACNKGAALCEFPEEKLPSTRPCSECGPSGHQVCIGRGTELLTTSDCRPLKARSEIDCNLCDDDGDGSANTINEVVMERSCSEVGGCSTSKCQSGTWGRCSPPRAEICNGIDDTCDALVDEGNACGLAVGCECQPVACAPNFTGQQPDGCGNTLSCTASATVNP